MLIEDVVARRDALEATLYAAITTFEAETGVIVTDVDLMRLTIVNDNERRSRLVRVDTTTRLP